VLSFQFIFRFWWVTPSVPVSEWIANQPKATLAIHRLVFGFIGCTRGLNGVSRSSADFYAGHRLRILMITAEVKSKATVVPGKNFPDSFMFLNHYRSDCMSDEKGLI